MNRILNGFAGKITLFLATLAAIQTPGVCADSTTLAVPNSGSVPNGTPVKQTDSSTEPTAEHSSPTHISRHSGFALTLAGGGARGAAHIGVLKVLDAAGLRPDFIAGSSMGAVIGGLYAAGVPVSEIEQLALSGELEKAFFPSNRKLQTITYLGPYFLARAVLIHPEIGLYSGKAVSKFIRKHLPQGVSQIEDMPIPFSAAAVDLTTTKSVWLSKGSIADAIRASNSAPGFIRPFQIGKQVLVDGGVRTNLPTEIAQAQGAPTVVAVRLQAYLEKVDQKNYNTIMNYMDRVSSILLAEIENKAVDKSDIVIEPKMAWMKMSSFKKEELQSAITAGEIAARKALPKLRACLAQHQNENATLNPL